MASGDAYDVFVSYARSDEVVAGELNGWLCAQGLRTFFDRSDLRPGLRWIPALEDAIGRSKAVAILVGKHGIGNTQQYERELALIRQTADSAFPVIPVLMPGCDSPPTGFLKLLTWIDLSKSANVTERTERLAELRAALQGVTVASAIRASICPYRGLEPFREEDAAFFCGRDGAIRELVARVEAYEFVAVVGPSGSGKSSLVFAGLLPALRKQGRTRMWDVVTLRPGKSPLRAFAEVFGAMPENAGPAAMDTYVEGEVTAYRVGDADKLARIVDRRLDAAPEKPDRLLIYIDQWEELYAMAPPPEDKERLAQHSADVEQFIELLVAAASGAGSRANVVLTVRADFYNPLIRNPALAALLPKQQVNIPPMSRDDLRSAIETPAKTAGLSFAPPELVDRILDDVGLEEGRLPLLQFALKETWQRREGDLLTAEAYTEVGGVANAIEKTAEDAYERLTAVQKDAARRLFLRLVTPGEGQADTRARSPIPDDPEQRDIVARFSNPKTRLLVTALQAEGPAGDDVRATVEVAHEALIQRWPTLRDWVRANRENLRARAAILRAKLEWEEKGKSEDYLLPRGVQLERGRALLENPGDVAVDDIRDYVDRSIEKDERRLSAERVAAQEIDALVKAAATVVVEIPADAPAISVVTVSAGETWTFSASGEWRDRLIRCGPDGYLNILADALEIKPRASGNRWLQLVGEIEGQPDSSFPIGSGCTHTFEKTGKLRVFANHRRNGCKNDGRVQLRGRPGGSAQVSDSKFDSGLNRFLDVFAKIRGIPVIAALIFGICLILVFTLQGQDLVGGIGEDDFWQYPSGLLQIAFLSGLFFLAVEAWGWATLVIISNYGPDRRLWRPNRFLVWTPRVLGAMPFAAAATALTINPSSNTFLAVLVMAAGLIFFILVLWLDARDHIAATFRRKQRAWVAFSLAGAGLTMVTATLWLGVDDALIALAVVFLGITFIVAVVVVAIQTATFRWTQRAWVIFSLAGAGLAMVVATLWPVRVGDLLGAPAVVFIDLGFIIPVIVVAIQMGASFRIPVVAPLLVMAIPFSLFNDNHAVRYVFEGTSPRPIDRLTLTEAYEQWRAAQKGGADAKKTMILVAAQGGGSRAGYWTALALSELRQAARARGVDLDEHLFAISSVSGGSIGSVGYAAMLRASPDAPDFVLRLLRFVGQNSLGPAMVGLFPDLLQRFLPVAFLPDRAEAQEKSWEDAWASIDPEAPSAALMRRSFLDLAPQAGQPWRPILIVQGTSENSGRRVLTSGVKFACDEVDADDFLDSIGHDVPISTAILNGARFPWISPGGTFVRVRCGGAVKQPDHIVEGGYFDNAGTETLREMARAIRALPRGGEEALDIVFVLIGYLSPELAAPTPLIAINDVFAPLFSFASSSSAHEEHLAREIKLVGQVSLGDSDPYTTRITGSAYDYAAIILCKGSIDSGGRLESYEPPNWSLSGKAKRYIENSLIATSPACNAGANAQTINAIVKRL